MKLLAQLRHEPPMLDLGIPGAVLYLFQCLACFGIPDSGRVGFIVEPTDLGSAAVRVPDYDAECEGQRLIGELWIAGWRDEEDGIPATRLPEFFDEGNLWALQDEFPNIDWYSNMTKFGGSPRWTGNGPMNFPPPPFEFLLQLGNADRIEGPPPEPDQVGCVVFEYSNEAGSKNAYKRPKTNNRPINGPWTVMHEYGAEHFRVEYTNLGSDGTAYVFIDRSQKPHQVKWFWNR